ncbi:hypothetical protein [Lyticum sinuosum]|uniref:hypothetical protein n=1 Tax=Lyticum sinuosum TaxID=1332059 RepID=UPI002ACE444F|nr:hypothetical protein [Lyticum sinuosum]
MYSKKQNIWLEKSDIRNIIYLNTQVDNNKNIIEIDSSTSILEDNWLKSIHTIIEELIPHILIDKQNKITKNSLDLAFFKIGKNNQGNFYFPNGIRDFSDTYMKIITTFCINRKNLLKLQSNNKGVSDMIIEILEEVIDELFSLKYNNDFNDIKNYSIIKTKISSSVCKNLITYNNPLYYWKFSSEIWYTINDKSTDFNFYTKRYLLSIIWFLIIRYMSKIVNINTSNILQINNELKNYMKRKINNILYIQKLKRKFYKKFSYMKNI